MKILFLSTAYPYRGGIASFNQMLACELQRQQHEVEIWTFTVQYPSFLFPGKTQYSEDAPPKGLKIKRVLNSINPFNWIATGIKIYRQKPDILFLRYWSPYLAPALAVAAYMARLNGKTRVVALADNIIAHEKHSYDNFLTRFFVGCVDSFVVMSREVESDLKTFNVKKPIHYSPHPIYQNYGEKLSKNDACRALGLDSSCRYLLFFGLIRPYKGLDLLLEAWAKFGAKGGEKLLVVGEYYTPKEPYLEQIQRLRIDESVIVVDKFIPDDEVKNYFCASDAIVQPYKTATQSGITQIAYNFDTPMVVTNVGGLAEIVPNDKVGYVVEPNSDEIAEAIDKIIQPTNQELLRQNFEEEKKRFSWESIAGKVTL